MIKKNLFLTFAISLVFVSFQIDAQVNKKGLIIHYSFDKKAVTGKDIKDLSGNKNHGVIKGSQKTVKGKVGEGMEFKGSAPDYISVRNHHYSKANVEEFSVMAWVKAPSRGMIASWDRSEFFRFGVGDDQLGNNDFIAFDTCCGIHDWHGKKKITDDKWHHVLATYDGKKKQIYVDGKLDAETAVPHKVMGKAITRYGFIGIGSEAGVFDGPTGPNWAFKGLMDEFLLYHRALTNKEAKHLSTGPANPFVVDVKEKLALSWGNIKTDQ